jgi:hypothetical protein
MSTLDEKSQCCKPIYIDTLIHMGTLIYIVTLIYLNTKHFIYKFTAVFLNDTLSEEYGQTDEFGMRNLGQYLPRKKAKNPLKMHLSRKN